MHNLFGYSFRSQVTPFVILFIERDGSTYLTSMLQSHPHIKAEYEKFAVMRQRDVSAAEQLAWLNDFFTPPLINRFSAIGFKTKLVDILDRDGFTKVLLEKGCHLIQMKRRNLVKAVVSRINARRLYDKTGSWNLYREDDRLPPVVIDLQEFEQFIHERELADQELDEYVNNLNLPNLKIVYEDLLLNKDRILKDVFHFIGVKPWPVEGKPLKATKDDLREVISNFEELRSHYRDTKYLQMFDEVLI